MQSHYDVRVTILGQKDSGKTALFNRYVYEEFGKTSMTLGAYFGMKQPKIDDTPVDLSIWDTAGDEAFLEQIPYYCRQAKVLYYVINGSKHKPDIDEKTRAQELDEDIRRLKIFVNEAPNAEVHILINRSDDTDECKDASERAKATERAIIARLTKEEKDENSPLNGKSIEVTKVSAKTGENVVEAIHSSVSKIVARIKQAVQSEPKAKAKQAVQLKYSVEAKQAVQKVKSDRELLSDMASMRDRLNAELKSFPCLNEGRKTLKRDFLDRVIDMYKKDKESKSLRDCIALVEDTTDPDDMQKIVAGIIRNRTKSFFQENGLNLKVLLPKATQESSLHPFVEVRTQR